MNEDLLTKLQAIEGLSLQHGRSLVSARQEAATAKLVIRVSRPGQVGPVLKVLNECRQPVVILAGNTGLVGAGTPSESEAVLDVSQLTQVKALVLTCGTTVSFSEAHGLELAEQLLLWDQDLLEAREKDSLELPAFRDAKVICEAGVTVDGLNALLRPLGIEYPMDMGSNSAATLGGCTANASAGARSLRNGTGAHMAVCARGVWASGDSAESLNEQLKWPPEESDDQPLIDSSRFPLGNSLIGSQGTLGVITEVEVITSLRGLATEVVLVGTPDLTTGLTLVNGARCFFQNSGESLELAELIDHESLRLVREKEGVALQFDDPSSEDSPFFIMLQVRADLPEAADSLQERLLEFLEAQGELAQHLFYDPDSGAGNPIRTLRHSITHASDARLGEMKAAEALSRGLDSTSEDLLTVRLGFDVAVPLDRIDQFANAWREHLDRNYPELEHHAFGHLGVGGFHLHVRGAMSKTVRSTLKAELSQLVLQHHGTFSAEHGVGTLWASMFEAHMQEELRERMGPWFAMRDPNQILNPRCFAKSSL